MGLPGHWLLLALGSCGLMHDTSARPAQDADASTSSVAEGEDLTPEEIRRRDRPSGTINTEDTGWLWSRVAGLGGLREQLEDRGVAVEFLYSGDASWVASGDAVADHAFERGLLELTLQYDTSAAFGFEGGTALASLQGIHGGDPSEGLGVLQPLSGVDAERRIQLGRIWYQQEFTATDTRVRAGKIDANSLFAYVDGGSQFLHSSMGFSPTIFLMPSYPDAAFGLTIVQSFGVLGVRAGAFDGAFARGVRTGELGLGPLFDGGNDYFFIGEADATWSRGRVAFGAWQSTSRVPRFDGASEDGTGGYYATAESRLWTSRAAEPDTLDGFLQWGNADREVSIFEEHFGAGLAWKSPAGHRQPTAGIGLSRATLSRAEGSGFSASAETAIELYFGFEPFRWVRIKPDLQWVNSPGGDASRSDLWLATIRFTLAI
ncbi:Carbohydrate-selective porin, OprB family [Planctomycetes bacterium Poly30]|uniref:Carbohydrate-selective porin, OprB family n=1 Tax=Saltatorellus ferox TaxID=2528018 RepID=A0A518EPT4_9BACT|nr:Carbohydrate-selective porin, OprB family [Planctomycetes bacterium Poly30]